MSSVRAVDRAIDILTLLTRERRTLGIAEIQSGLKLSRPTLYRLLETLAARGLVRVEGDPQRYALDVGVLRFADAWAAQTDVVMASERVLADLWNRTDETVALALPLGDDRWVLAKEHRSRQPLAYGRGIGHAHALTIGASGRVILAYVEAEKAERSLLQEPDAAKREQLRSDLDQIRRKGFDVAVGELIVGAMAISAPVFDHNGSVVASLCIYGPEIRLKEPTRGRYISLLIEEAQRLSKILGHQSVAMPTLPAAHAS